MVAGAAIMGGASLLGAGIQANAATQAAQDQQQTQMYALGLANQNLQPILGEGKQISGAVMQPALAMSGAYGPQAQMQELENQPGYQFSVQQADKQVMNMGTTMGLSGNTLYGAAQAVSGINQQYANNYMQNLYNMLALGLGTQTQAAGTLTGAQTSAVTAIGNAQANAALTTGTAYSGALGNIGTVGALAALKSSGTGDTP